jgi:ABC-type antimicrobial peptide transport system permease subunit
MPGNANFRGEHCERDVSEVSLQRSVFSLISSANGGEVEMSRTQRIGRDVLASLASHKSRAFLMMLGVTMGVAVLSAVIAISQGTTARVMELVQHHNLDMIMVRAGGDVQVFAPRADRGLSTLFPEDARAIEQEIPNIDLVSVTQNKRGVNLVYEDRSAVTRLFGVDPSFSEIRHRPLIVGEFISSADMSSMARIAILGDLVAKTLFPEGGAVGRTIRVENEPYVVKGVFAPVGMAANNEDNQDDRVVIPYTTSARRMLNRSFVEQIVMRVVDTSRMAETAERVRELLRVRHNIAEGRPDDFFVREPDHVVDAALQTPRMLFSLMAAVSIVALIGGGLVITNLMLISISQRSKEIGLRRAVGARTADIAQQFLLESLFISLMGGVVGVALGLMAAWGLDAAGIVVSRITWLPFVSAFAACTVVGLAFGVQPARRAAHLDPATSLSGRAA